MSERILSKGRPFTADISCLDFTPTGAERQIEIWRDMIRAKITVPPIKVCAKPNLPGRWSVLSGAVAVEAAKLEGLSDILCVLV